VVKEVLGTLEADAPEALLDFIIKGDSRGALLFVNKLFDEGANLIQFTHDFLELSPKNTGSNGEPKSCLY